MTGSERSEQEVDRENMATERVFMGEGGQWYFNVRGNQAQGPFATRPEAEQSLARHVDACRSRLEGGMAWPRPLKSVRLLRRLRPASGSG
jgi:hypothetical protein